MSVTDKIKFQWLLTRRNFLFLLSGALGGIAASGIFTRPLGILLKPVRPDLFPPSGPEKFTATTCGACPGGCGLVVRGIGKRAVKVEGNPLHPINRGGTCPKGQAALQSLYHPDRITQPMRRSGERGQGKWEPISWETAIQMITVELKKLRDTSHPERLLFLSGESRGMTHELFQRFMQAYGTPNDFQLDWDAGVSEVTLGFAHGKVGPIAYDLENTNFILSFSAPLLEGWGSPVYMMRAFGNLRQGRRGQRGILVQADSRLSVTASHADQWLPVRPGTEAALALGIARVLIAENLYDPHFIEKFTFGFEDFVDAHGKKRQGFKNYVLTNYSIEVVSRITGLKPKTILATARAFAKNRPAIAVVGREVITQSHGEYAAFAIHSLNALVGSIDAPGGILIQPPSSSLFQKLKPLNDEWSKKSTGLRLDGVKRQDALLSQKPARLPKALIKGEPYPIAVAMIHRADPLFTGPHVADFREGLKRVPFIACFSTFLTETAQQADLILPEHHFFERMEIDPTPPAVPFRVVSLRQPVIAPRLDTRHSAEVILEIARQLGGNLAGALPWKNLDELMQAQIDGLFREKGGAILGSHQEEAWMRALSRSGWNTPSYRSATGLLSQMKESGGWWNPYYSFGNQRRIYNNPSKRFEFFSLGLLETLGAKADDLKCLPHYQPAALEKDIGDYPLILNAFVPLPFMDGEGAHLHSLQNIAGVIMQEKWGTWAEINPQTAKAYGIRDGDAIFIESAKGKIKAKARHYEGAIPGFVNVPIGQGNHGVGSNPLSILTPGRENFSGLQSWASTWVKVKRI